VAARAFVYPEAAWTTCETNQRIIKGALDQYTMEELKSEGTKVGLTNLLMDYLKGWKPLSCPLGGTYPDILIVGVSNKSDASLCSLGGREEHIRIAWVRLLTPVGVITAILAALLATAFRLSHLKKRKSIQAQ